MAVVLHDELAGGSLVQIEGTAHRINGLHLALRGPVEGSGRRFHGLVGLWLGLAHEEGDLRWNGTNQGRLSTSLNGLRC